MNTMGNVIGVPRRRVDGRAKATGQTKYADDLDPAADGVRQAAALVPRPMPAWSAIDTARAAAHPGVLLILTGKDLPIPYGILPVTQDEHALALDKVRFVGDPVALVVARDEITAAEAAELVDVQYERLTTIADYDDALSTSEPRIHDYGAEGNVHKKVAMQFGDVDEALAEADQVFEDVFFYEGNTHLALEQHATVAYLDGDGKLVVYSSTQTPHYLHRALAKALAMPAAHIRVIAAPNGGGFGGKSDPFNHEIAVAKAALLLDRPVKITLTREEVFYCHRGRHPVMMKFRTGVKKDGTLTAVHLQTILDGGAYGSYGVASTFYTGALQTVTYHVPRYKFEGCRVFTNKAPCGPKRGHGTPQSRFGQEVQIDKIAERMGIDPATFRLRIVEQPNTLTANFLRVSTIGLAECIRRVVKASDWTGRYRQLGRGRGLGLACSSYLSGAGLPIYWNDMPHSAVQLKLDRSGGVTAFCGAAEIGQGSDDVLVACVAEVLGIEPFDIRPVTGDTDLTPVDLGSYSSRVTLMMGNAAIEAAERARDILAAAVETKLGIPRRRLVFAENGASSTPKTRRRGMSFREAICAAEAMFGAVGTVGSYTPPKSAAGFKGGGVGPSPTYSYTAAVVEVEVDESSGWVTVPRVWVAHDIGRALNPTLVRGQVEGSVYMALGEALMEEQAYRRLATAAFERARAQVSIDARIQEPHVARHARGHHRTRGKSGSRMGRLAPKKSVRARCLPIMPAVANAVYDAVGVRIDEVPITPDKIMKALPAKRPANPRDMVRQRSPTVSWPDALQVPPPWEGGTGHAIKQATSSAQRRRAPEGNDDSAAAFRIPRPIDGGTRPPCCLAEGGPDTMLLAGGTDLLPNMKRRQQTPRVLVALRGIDELRQHTNGNGHSIGAAPHALRDRSRSAFAAGLHRAVAGGGAGRDATLAGDGHTRRQSVPRYPLQLLRPVLRMAEGDRLLHEEGRRSMLGRDVEPNLPGGLFDRHGAGAHRARCERLPGLVIRHSPCRNRRSVSQRRHRLPDAPTGRNPDLGPRPRHDGLAQHLLETATPRLVRLSGAWCRQRR